MFFGCCYSEADDHIGKGTLYSACRCIGTTALIHCFLSLDNFLFNRYK